MPVRGAEDNLNLPDSHDAIVFDDRPKHDRIPSKQDRRKILIQRTQRDKDLEDLYVQVSQEMTHIWYAGFSDTRIKRFEADLQKILDNLTDTETR